nr:homeobox protein VENTX [Pogona vitticeps]
MTKAPFSVEWLSQSSQPSTQRRTRAREGKEAASSSFPDGIPAQQGDPSPDGQQAGRGSQLDDGTVGPEVEEAPSKHLPSLQKNLGTSSSSSAGRPLFLPSALAAPKQAWSATESGSDGEGSVSERRSPESGSGVRSTSTRRLRTAFSLEQISTLESSFKRHKYLGAAERRKLATKMQLSEVQIKTWFQNRRMKLKRQLQEMRPEAFHSAPFYNPLPFGPQNGPLSYVYSPQQQPFNRREASLPSGLPFPPVSAPTLDPRSTSEGQSAALWPMPMPYFLGYHDPRTLFMALR